MTAVVSCCVSTWNRLPDLQRCINSILSQTYPYIEIVIVDNCSSDGTYEYCHELIKASKFPVLYKQMDHDQYSAMTTLNTAYNMVDGNYILTLDDDAILIDYNIIEKSVKYMENHIQCFAISYRVINIDGEDELDYTALHDHAHVPEFFGAGFFARLDIFDQLNFFDESLGLYGNELDVSIRSYIQGHYITYLHDLTILHNRHINSLYTGYKSKYMLMNSLNAPIKYFDYYHKMSMVIGYGIGHMYYLVFKIKSLSVLLWWLTWYPFVLLKSIISSNEKCAPLWIQQYYCNRMLQMFKSGGI